jgi:hypothetical protein
MRASVGPQGVLAAGSNSRTAKAPRDGYAFAALRKIRQVGAATSALLAGSTPIRIKFDETDMEGGTNSPQNDPCRMRSQLGAVQRYLLALSKIIAESRQSAKGRMDPSSKYVWVLIADN